jgi:hypothetical protein
LDFPLDKKFTACELPTRRAIKPTLALLLTMDLMPLIKYQHNCPDYNQEKPEVSNASIAYQSAEWIKEDKP